MGLNEIMKIGTRMRSARMEKGFSQKKMAQLLEISYSAYSNYENNNRVPTIDNLQKIANALGLSLSELMGLEYKENTLDTNDVFEFYNSLGYLVTPIKDNEYRLLSRDITSHIEMVLTWDELKKIKDDIWMYLKFTLNEKLKSESAEPDKE